MDFLINVQRIVNLPITSNCFVITSEDSFSCIVVDPGSLENQSLINYLDANNLSVSKVILTHEHFDHIGGVINLYSKFEFQLLCSLKTAVGIADNRINLSYYHDQIQPIEIFITPKIVNDNDELIFGGNPLTFYLTPGHSAGSTCFNIGNYFFTGDTILDNKKTRLNLPGSSKKYFAETKIKLDNLLKFDMRICPGHGDCFIYNQF